MSGIVAQLQGSGRLARAGDAIRRVRDTVVREVRAVARGFLRHGFPGRLYILVVSGFGAAVSASWVSALFALIRPADALVLSVLAFCFVLVLGGAYIALVVAGFWWIVRSFAHFRRSSRWHALAVVAQLFGITTVAWYGFGRPPLIGLAALAWLLLAVQLIVYFLRERELWNAAPGAQDTPGALLPPAPDALPRDAGGRS